MQNFEEFEEIKGQQSKYLQDLKERLEECWEAMESEKLRKASELKANDPISSKRASESEYAVPAVVSEIMDALDSGKIRVVDRACNNQPQTHETRFSTEYVVNEYVKKAILLYFKFSKPSLMSFGGANCFDKVPLKSANWTAADFAKAGFRAAPGAIIRYSAYIAPNVVVMQSFVNVGAFVDEGSMLDTYSLVGSCAQVGKHCHISAGAVLGGVLEPLQASPVIIEDDCFIGAGSSVTEGVIVERGAVVASGVHLTASTKIIDKDSGKVSFGRVPEYAVVVPGTYSSGAVNLGCAIIIKRRDAKTCGKVSINELLRDDS